MNSSIKSSPEFREFIKNKNMAMKELTVKDLINALHGFEDDAIVLICDWDQEAKYGYNYTTINEIVDEQQSFTQTKRPIKILTRDGGVVPHTSLRGAGRRFVVLQ